MKVYCPLVDAVGYFRRKNRCIDKMILYNHYYR